jgi:hypothetical protein
MLAARYGHPAVVNVLLEKGAKLEVTSKVNGRCCWAQTLSYNTWAASGTVMVYSVFVINASRVPYSEWWVQACAASPSQLCAACSFVL